MTIYSFRMLLDRFQEFIRRERLIGRDEHILVAVSGGIDSSVMLDLLSGLELGLTLAIAHVNFGLRGEESDGDEVFVRSLGNRYRLPVFVDRPPTEAFARSRKFGIQEAARELRYAFFQKVMKEEGFVSVATAHNADDNAETVILNLLRGSGAAGMSGIPAYREEGSVIRPLLFATRDEIAAYALEAKIGHREDSSNAKEDYTRNVIRRRILPLVRERINPSVSATLLRSSALFRELETYLEGQAEEATTSAIVSKTDSELRLSAGTLAKLPVFLRQMVIRAAVQSVAGITLGSTPTRAVAHLTGMQTGQRITLSAGWEASRDRDVIIIRARTAEDPLRVRVAQGERCTIGETRFSSELFDGLPPGGAGESVDADIVGSGDLVLRNWEEGDAFTPLGMRGMKKLSDFFIDEKVPLHEKRHTVVLTTEEGTVIWVCGLRLDDRFRITAATRRVLRMTFTRDSNGGHG